MQLRCISYKEYEGRDQEWVLDGLALGSRNLLVGKNSTGKSRSLNVIGGLGKFLCGEVPPTILSAHYKAIFSEGGKELVYTFHAEDELVLSESFSIDGRMMLRRGERGEGTIFAEKIDGGKEVEFQTPQNELAATVRRDAKQHSFLQCLYDWGSSVRHYHFGSTLGKDRFAVFVPNGAIPDDKDAGQIVAIFRKAMNEHPRDFQEAMLRDMERVDYPLDDIGIGPPLSIRVQSALPGELVGIWVKEKGLKAITDQHVMSQGMFRVLALLTLVNYLELTKKAGCVIVDDIGEGIDFDRACLLIDLLREKADKSSIQLIAATNDKFVMNNVPLAEWSVLQRRGSHLHVLNQQNSREMFEEFRFTGLSNFSFLEMDFPNAQTVEALAP